MPTFLPLVDAPVAHWGVSCDPGAKQRRGSGEIQVSGYAENEFLIDDDAIGVAAVSDASRVLVGKVVGEDESSAELLERLLAFGAGPAGINHATDGSKVAGFELGYG